MTYILCVWMPLKMCSIMPPGAMCFEQVLDYERRKIYATCEPINRWPEPKK